MLADFLEANSLAAKILDCQTEVHTAKQAATLMKVPLEQILKSVLFVDSEHEPFLVLVPGNKQGSFPKLKELFGVKKLRLADPEEVLEITGYPIGGIPPVSVYGVKTVMDLSFEKQKFVLAGGGDEQHLLHISIDEIKKSVPDLVIAAVTE